MLKEALRQVFVRVRVCSLLAEGERWLLGKLMSETKLLALLVGSLALIVFVKLELAVEL